MIKYFLNREPQANGDHEVHNENCNYLPTESNRKYLGMFNNCQEAVREASNYYSQVNGCYHCSYDCHTR